MESDLYSVYHFLSEAQTMIFPAYASVMLDLSINRPLDYGIPQALLETIVIGARVEVPLRGVSRSGYVVAIKEQSGFPSLQPICRLLSDVPPIPAELLKLALWIAEYYCSSLNHLFRFLLPPGVRKGMKHKEQLFVMRGKTKEELSALIVAIRHKKPAQASVLEAMLKVKKGVLLTKLLESAQVSRTSVDALVKQGLLIVEPVRIDRSPIVGEEYFMTKPKQLNPSQSAALNRIALSLHACRFETHLLFGVTGSGKTEVYLQAIDLALKEGKGVIMLVPEISLTTQTIERFKSRFQEKIAILHHRLSQGEKNDAWHEMREGRAKIVIGARSAIFSPIVNLGLIIVDEEHDASYKQTDLSPCYQARDVAVMRGSFSASTVILGTATPSLESYYNALLGKYTLSNLEERASASASLPKVTIVDMRKEFEKAKRWTNFSEPLLNGIEKRLKLGEQTILFLNRRGYHAALLCQKCRQAVKCRHCDVSLSFHKESNRLCCHLCGFGYSPPPRECPACGDDSPLVFKGAGTEQIEKALHAIFPTIRTLRADADTTRHKGSQDRILKEFGTGKADVLIGTQMIAKGLHFPEVTLVGIVNGDSSLTIPDFRASENTFQLITQVAGRSGRGVLPGEVIIQTSMPDNKTIQHAAKQEYVSFFNEEIEVRKFFDYPPFSRIAKILFSGKQEAKILAVAEGVRARLLERLPPHFEVHPVLPCGYAKIKNDYRFQFLIKGPSMSGLNQLIQTLPPIGKHVKMLVDVSPSSTFF